MTPEELKSALCRPFPAEETGWKPQAVKGNRAMAVAYLDARSVADRLDEVFGPGGWGDEYVVTPGGDVICSIRCLVDGAWVSKSDTGGESEQPDAGDRRKSAFSDAFKRAGVKWGVGRYLYDLPKQWCDYDPVKKQFVSTPQLPANIRRQAAEHHTPAEPHDDAPPAVVRDFFRRLATATTEDELRQVWADLQKGLILKNKEYADQLTRVKDQRKRELQSTVPAATTPSQPVKTAGELLQEVLAAGAAYNTLLDDSEAFAQYLYLMGVEDTKRLHMVGVGRLQQILTGLTLKVDESKRIAQAMPA